MNYQDDAISFHNVSYAVNGQSILTEITSSFSTGKITTLLGPSGSGKTTILKLCNGLLSPVSGDIAIQGEPIHDYEPTFLRRKVALALQESPMIPGTVYDNLVLPFQLQGEKLLESQAKQALSDIGLPSSYLHHDSDDLSGGQKQRVALARTLMSDADILLLDEVTSGLDQEAMYAIEQLIASWQLSRDATIIWITHDIAQAKRVANRMWLLTAGKLIEAGDIQLLDTSKKPEVRHFVQGDSL